MKTQYYNSANCNMPSKNNNGPCLLFVQDVSCSCIWAASPQQNNAKHVIMLFHLRYLITYYRHTHTSYRVHCIHTLTEKHHKNVIGLPHFQQSVTTKYCFALFRLLLFIVWPTKAYVFRRQLFCSPDTNPARAVIRMLYSLYRLLNAWLLVIVCSCCRRRVRTLLAEPVPCSMPHLGRLDASSVSARRPCSDRHLGSMMESTGTVPCACLSLAGHLPLRKYSVRTQSIPSSARANPHFTVTKITAASRSR